MIVCQARYIADSLNLLSNKIYFILPFGFRKDSERLFVEIFKKLLNNYDRLKFNLTTSLCNDETDKEFKHRFVNTKKFG